MDIRRALRDARSAAGLTQRDLADRSGLSPVGIASYEAGRRPLSTTRLDDLLRICGVEGRIVLERPHAHDARAVALLAAIEPAARVPFRQQSGPLHRAREAGLEVRWGGALAARVQGVPVAPIAATVVLLPEELRGSRELVRTVG